MHCQRYIVPAIKALSLLAPYEMLLRSMGQPCVELASRREHQGLNTYRDRAASVPVYTISSQTREQGFASLYTLICKHSTPVGTLLLRS